MNYECKDGKNNGVLKKKSKKYVTKCLFYRLNSKIKGFIRCLFNFLQK